MAMKFNCGCAVTIREIAIAATAVAGHTVSDGCVRRWRAVLAQSYLDRAFKAADDGCGGWEKGCIRNPYLPTRQIGRAHAFTAAAARRLIRDVANCVSASHHARAVRRYRLARAAVGV